MVNTEESKQGNLEPRDMYLSQIKKKKTQASAVGRWFYFFWPWEDRKTRVIVKNHQWSALVHPSITNEVVIEWSEGLEPMVVDECSNTPKMKCLFSPSWMIDCQHQGALTGSMAMYGSVWVSRVLFWLLEVLYLCWKWIQTLAQR